MSACPECGTVSTVVITDGKVVEGSFGDYITVRQVDPSYCPVCGYPLARDGLVEDAERAMNDG